MNHAKLLNQNTHWSQVSLLTDNWDLDRLQKEKKKHTYQKEDNPYLPTQNPPPAKMIKHHRIPKLSHTIILRCTYIHANEIYDYCKERTWDIMKQNTTSK